MPPIAFTAYLDCHAGIDGEAFLAALLASGVSRDILQQRLALLPLPAHTFSFEQVKQGEIRALRVQLELTPQAQETYSRAELTLLLASFPNDEAIHDTLLPILSKLITADTPQEEDVTPDDKNSLEHGVTAHDLILATGILIAVRELAVTQLYFSPLPLSYSHNATTPAKAVELLRVSGALWQPSSIEHAKVTPLVAAIMSILGRFEPPTMTIERVGYGILEPPQQGASYVRCHVGVVQSTTMEALQEDTGMESDEVTVLSTNIDNMSGELLGSMVDRLLVAGALDVSYTPMQMKKNRPAVLLMVVCPVEKTNELAYILLRETTTLGVRVQHVRRLKAQRAPMMVETPLGSMLVKVKRLGDQIVSASPEYEECLRIATEHNLPLADVYALAQQCIANRLERLRSESIN